MNIFTIGFSQKTAEEFFTLLMANHVEKLIDIRLNNQSQLSGFTNIKHLPYFLGLHNMMYDYKNDFAPTKKLLDDYKNKIINWGEYERQYNQILRDRDVINKISIKEFENAVLLCSEPTAIQCHRRLVAEYIAKGFDNINIKHL